MFELLSHSAEKSLFDSARSDRILLLLFFRIAVFFQGFFQQSLSVLILQTGKNLGGNPVSTVVKWRISIGLNGPGIHPVTT